VALGICLAFCLIVAADGFTFHYPSAVTILENSTFDGDVTLDAKRYWVIDFYAPWCPHCRDFAPVFGAMAMQLKSKESALKFGAVDCIGQKSLCQRVNITGFPTTRMYHHEEIVFESVGEENVTEFGGKLKNELTSHGLTDVATLIDTSVKVTLTPQVPKLHRWKPAQLGKVQLQDLAVAVHFGLNQGVYLTASKPLNGKRMEAMKTWLNTLNMLLPKNHTLGTLISFLQKKTSVKQSEWDPVAQKVEVFGFKNSTKPLGCKGFTHGVSCTLWLLFHSLLQRTSSDVQGLDTLGAIRAYVLNFFECKSCQEHFRAVTKDFRKHLHTQQDTVMYIWLVHNLVTERLAKPHGYVGDVFFPPASACPTCRKGGKYPDVDWNNDEVWKYLAVYCLDGKQCLSNNAKQVQAKSKLSAAKTTGGKIAFSSMALPLAAVTLIIALGAGIGIYAYKASNVKPGYSQVPGGGAKFTPYGSSG
jgi:thiol oxidase